MVAMSLGFQINTVVLIQYISELKHTPPLMMLMLPAQGSYVLFFFQAEDGIRDLTVTGVQTCALPICTRFLGVYIAVSRSRRASGTFDIPTVASPLPWAVRPVSRTLVMSWKRVDFPLDATPMRAALSMDETRIVPDGDRKPIRGASDVDRMCGG